MLNHLLLKIKYIIYMSVLYYICKKKFPISLIKFLRPFILLLTIFIIGSGFDWRPYRVFTETGISEKATLFRTGINLDWEEKIFETSDGYFSGYWEFSLGQWNFKNNNSTKIEASEFAITPVFRFSGNHKKDVSFYFEAAVGLHLLTSTFVRFDRKLGSQFQFGNHAGIGVIILKNIEFSYRFQHLSNAGISEPNAGINFHQLRLGFNL